MIEDFHFLRPWWLALALPALLLCWLHRRRGNALAPWRGVIDPDLLRHFAIGSAGRRRLAPADLLLAGWIVGLLALAGPAWQREASPFADQAPPAMIVLRVAPSMLTADLMPTRADRARQKISDLIALRPGAAFGLVAYGGSAHLVLPPTPDGTVVETMAASLSPAIMPREGDALAAAVALADGILTGNGQGGSILVIADTVAPDQIAGLKAATAPLQILALQPNDPSTGRAARAAGGRLVALTIEAGAVAANARRMAWATAPVAVRGEGQRWREAGYWLTPLIALIALLWFRRGWALP